MSTPSVSDEATRKRTRASLPKTRTGCHTCKRRRVKCDERKPACIRCTSTARKCDGYDILFGFHTETHGRTLGEPAANINRTSNGNQAMIYQRLTHLPGVSFHERRWYEFFRSQTAQDVPGLFRSAFWGSLVLQASHSEPAILHASVAVGALHQKNMMDGMAIPIQNMTNRLLQFAIQQYNKSVSHLNKRLTATQDRGSREILLMACILFVCLELLRGHYATALLHLDSGRNILQEYLAQSRHSARDNVLILPSSPHSVEDELVEIFARLDIQSTNFGSFAPRFHLLTEKSATSAELRIPKSFSSLLEARQNLDSLLNAITRFIGLSPDPSFHNLNNPAAVTQRDKLLIKLQEWSEAFQAFQRTRNTSIDPRSAQKEALLLLHHRFLHTRLSVCLFGGIETKYDEFTDNFEAIISLADGLIRGRNTIGPDSPPYLPQFSIDIGTVQPLYFTVIRCRVPHVRRRALSLLSSTPRREGMWDAAFLSTVGARVIELEEAGIEPNGDADHRNIVPESSRFSEVRVYIIGDGSEGATLHCKQRREDEPDGWVVRAEFCAFDDGALVKKVLS